MPDGSGGSGEGAGGGSTGMGGSEGGGYGGGGDARGGMGFAGTGSGLAGSGVGAASTGMGGGTTGATGGGGTKSGWGSTAGSFIGGLLGSPFGPIGSLAGKALGGYLGSGGTFGNTGITGGGMADSTSGSTTGFGSGGPGSGNLSDYLSIASGLYSMYSSGGSGAGSAAQNAADPFSPYRADFAKQYAAAMAPGAKTDPTQLAGYSQFKSGILDPAMEASKRTAAAGGMQYSGAESASLQKIGQQGYSGFMTDYLNRLATGSGAGQSPYNAASLGVTTQGAADKATAQGVGAIGQGISGLFKGSGSLGGYVGGANTYGQAEYGTGTGYNWNSIGTVAPYDPYENLSEEQILYY